MMDHDKKWELLASLAEVRASLHVLSQQVKVLEKTAWELFGLEPSISQPSTHDSQEAEKDRT